MSFEQKSEKTNSKTLIIDIIKKNTIANTSKPADIDDVGIVPITKATIEVIIDPTIIGKMHSLFKVLQLFSPQNKFIIKYNNPIPPNTKVAIIKPVIEAC